MSTPWIELNQVDLDRGGRPVLRALEASLAGQAIGLVGANGAGKSTLIGAMLGVLRAKAGRIRVLGLDLPGAALDLRARAGVMAEQAGIYPGGSGVDAVAFAGQLTGLRRKEALRRAHRALDALDVGEERYRKTSGYSTGMRQRCKLAMSLVHDPEVLILDEPTVGLDPVGRLQLLSLIRDLRDEGRRILLSTHIMQDAEFLCDDMLLIEAGTVAYAGPVERLVSAGRDTYVAAGAGLDEGFRQALRAAGIEVASAASTTGAGSAALPEPAEAAHPTPATENLAPTSVTGTTEIRDASEAAPLVQDLVRFRSRGDEDLAVFWRLAAERGAEVRRLGPEIRSLEDAVVHVMTGSQGGGEELAPGTRPESNQTLLDAAASAAAARSKGKAP